MQNLTIEQKTEQILNDNGLNFQIYKVPMTSHFNGETYPSPYFGLLNSSNNKIIHVVKEGYHVSQNKDVVELVLKGLESFGNDITVQKAGQLREGRRVYMQLAVKGESRVGKDIIKRYITVIDSNDGSTGLSVGIGDLTMSCQNQFFKFYKSGHKLMHTASIGQKMNKIPLMIEEALSQSLRMIETYNKFVSTPASRDLVNQLINHVIGIDKTTVTKDTSTRMLNIMNGVYVHMEKEIACKGLNLWGLHSGVTSYTTNQKIKGGNSESVLENQMIGAGYHLNQKSLEFVSELV